MKAVLEKVSNPEESAITAFGYAEDRFSAPWHYHPEYELTCILASEGIRYVGNHISEYQPLDLVLVGANLPHRWKNSEEGEGKAHSLVIQWKPAILPAIVDLQSVQVLLAPGESGSIFQQSDSQTSAAIAESDGKARG